MSRQTVGECDQKTLDLILYIIDNIHLATVTSITKLLYLIDLTCISDGRKKVTNIGYVRYYYGPYSHSIKNAIDKLLGEKKIVARLRTLASGEPFLEYNIVPNSKQIEFEDDNKDIIDELLSSLGGLTPSQLTKIAYGTAPMKKIGATLGGDEHLNEMLDLDAK